MGVDAGWGKSSAERARLARIEERLASEDRLARLEASQAAIQASLTERREAEKAAAEAIQRKLEETAKAAADGLKSALDSANVIETERVARVNDRIASVERAAEVALASAEKAVTLTREDAIRTEIKQNEFRGALEDQSKRVELSMMPRKEFEAQHASLSGEVRATREESRTEIQHIREEIAEIRQAVAVGPPEIKLLQSGADSAIGARRERGDRRATSSVSLAAWMVGLTLLYTVIAAVGIIAASGGLK